MARRGIGSIGGCWAVAIARRRGVGSVVYDGVMSVAAAPAHVPINHAGTHAATTANPAGSASPFASALVSARLWLQAPRYTKPGQRTSRRFRPPPADTLCRDSTRCIRRAARWCRPAPGRSTRNATSRADGRSDSRRGPGHGQALLLEPRRTAPAGLEIMIHETSSGVIH